jgi:RNA polymerase sigma-70 factor (ECF subfamily)
MSRFMPALMAALPEIDRKFDRPRLVHFTIDDGPFGHGKSVPGLDVASIRASEPFSVPGPFFRSRVNEDERRLRQLMREHFDFVWRSLRRLGLDVADADEGTQEVFLVASRKLAVIARDSERQFLFGTALRVASTRRRSIRRRREEPHASLEEHDEGSAPGPERLVELSRARVQLNEVLAAMDLELRAPFVLFELEGLSVPEIAQLLSLPPGTVSSRLRGARDAFHAAVRRLRAREAFPGKQT